jgi:phosphoglycolate phosphatase-like HAD superfamily hydrolase
MKKIAVSYGVPADLIMGLERMALIWNTTRHCLEENGYSDDEIEAVIDEINVPFMAEEEADHATSILLPDTVKGLDSLKHLGYEMGLVTTASRVSYERISNCQDYGCFGKYFRYSVTRNDCKYIKPEPEPIYRILNLYNRSDFVYVGDADHDSQACKAAGGRFVLINTRGYDEATVASLEPDAVINSLLELPETLEEI